MDDFDRMRLAAHDIARSEAFENLSAQDINRMDMATFSRLTGRLAPAETVHAARRAAEQEPPAVPQTAPKVTQAPEDQPPGIDLANMDMETYAALRGQLGIGQGRQEGRGIFHSVGSQSQEYRDAARRQTGRTAYSQSNITPAPSLTGRQERQSDRLDHRPPHQRLSNQATMWQG